MNQLRLLILAMLLILCQKGFTQGIKGRLTDETNNPVPFAAVYDENTYLGTTSNGDGYYELKLPAGKHSLVFKPLGYYMERRSVETSNAFITINLVMKVQAYELKDVVVTPGKEDPAYAIMRKVISRAPYHLNQVKEYSSEAYLRGTIHIVHIPKIIANHIEVNGKKGIFKDGATYLEESINQIDFKAPDKYSQKVKSFHTTFPGENNVNPMQIMRSSFYQPKIEDIISPLAPNAFSYYKYRYEGYSNEGSNVIFKIKVTPKRNSQQLITGYIYIIDQLWCLHSVDASVDMFFGKMSYKEIFSSVKENVWLPISYVFYINASIMGIKADYKYTSSVKYQQVLLNEKNVTKPAKVAVAKELETPKPEKKPDTKKEKKQQEMEKLLTKENLSNREMIKLAGMMTTETKPDTAKSKTLEIKDERTVDVTIEKDALKKDSAYWNTIRPIPLTTVESGIKYPTDSAKVAAKDTIVKTDTSAVKKGKFKYKMSKVAFGGGGKSFFAKTTYLKYNGLVNPRNFSFNTVDGFIFRQSLDMDLKFDSIPLIKIKPGAAYAFSRKEWMWWVNTSFDYAPMRNGHFSIDYNKGTTDYNEEGGMNSDLNSLVSLIFRRNYKKFYEEHKISISNQIEIANGFNLNTSIGYRYEKMLPNYSDFSFFYRKTHEYTPNTPMNDALSYNLNNKEAYFKVELEYTPQYYYKVWGGKKQYKYSKYPTFVVNYKKAIPGIAGSNASFDYMEIGARQKKDWGMMHSFSWDVSAGKFLSQKNIFLSDFKFFNNQPLPVIFGRTSNSFFLPGLYENYTNKEFIEAHAIFSTPYLLVKYLPFLSNKIWLENLQLNYLYTKQIGHYWEAGYSISQIYAIGSVGVYAGFKGTEFQNVGVRFGFAVH